MDNDNFFSLWWVVPYTLLIFLVMLFPFLSRPIRKRYAGKILLNLGTKNVGWNFIIIFGGLLGTGFFLSWGLDFRVKDILFPVGIWLIAIMVSLILDYSFPVLVTDQGIFLPENLICWNQCDACKWEVPCRLVLHMKFMKWHYFYKIKVDVPENKKMEMEQILDKYFLKEKVCQNPA